MTSANEPAKTPAETGTDARSGSPIAELRAAYSAADKFAREVFEFGDDVAIPATNELRYAGHHLLRALGDDGQVVEPEHVRKAISHCHRAQYEAAEAGIASAIERISQFKEDYKLVELGEVIPDYYGILRLVRESQDMLPQERLDDGANADGEIPDPACYMDKFLELREKYRLLEDHRGAVIKRVRRDTEKSRFLIQCAVIILAAFITAAATVLAS